ncbi:hypothetical protein KIPB_001598 [Kipferlia bialata]|uniref:EGF-like domain-containing protein n=1 Tax=Kipferlia bialata TaxID=797122 RepID=A0A9K3CR10_9EUKA|nr:hypothetical protein KIPB_001598 [Kipferlia bialata]|eukprot:g1598.t1
MSPLYTEMKLALVTVTLLCVWVGVSAYPVLAPGLDPLDALGNSDDCHWNDSKTKCVGQCQTYCIETSPGFCGCSHGCQYDYGHEHCIGTCSSNEQRCHLNPVANNNHTCECNDCGLVSANDLVCSGVCPNGLQCIQPREDGYCQCSNEACTYDFRSDSCYGSCWGSHCRVTGPGVCSCIA